MDSSNADFTALEEDLKVHVFLSGPTTMAIRAVFAVVYCHEDMDSEGGKLTLQECFEKRHPEKDRAEIRNVFKFLKEVKDIELKNILEEDKLDITFYYHAITDFCKLKGDAPLSGHALDSLKQLKDMRNNFYHGGSLGSSPTTSLLENLCQQLMSEIEKEFGGIHIAEARPDINRLIHNVMNETFDIDQYINEKDKYIEILKQNFTSGSNRILRVGEFEMTTDPFKKLVDKSGRINHPFKHAFTPPLIFTERGVIDYQKILMAPIEEKKKPIIIVSGARGSGKSTLCRVILEEWQARASTSPSIEDLDTIDLIVFIELKFTASENLEDYLRKEYLVDEIWHVKKEVLAPLLSSMQILYIIDGYDEKSGNGRKLISDIASRNRHAQSQIIITTCSGLKDDCMKTFQSTPCLLLRLEGLGELQRNVFSTQIITSISNVDDDVTNLVDDFISYLEPIITNFESELKLPLTVALLIYFWLENKGNPKAIEARRSKTHLYRNLSEMLQEKLTKNDPSCKNVMREVQQIAFDLLKSNQHKLAKGMLMLIGKSCNLNGANKCEILGAFTKRDTPTLKDTSRACQRVFLCPTQMEYFSAYYVSNDLVHSTDGKCLKAYFQNCAIRRCKGMFPFVAGCLKYSGHLTSEHCKALIDLCGEAKIRRDDFNFWFSLLRETENTGDLISNELYDEIMKTEIIKFFRPLDSEKSWTLCPNTVVSGLRLLISCPEILIKELIFDFGNNYDPKAIRGLIKTLKELHTERCRSDGKSKRNFVFEVRGQDLADPYLQYFADWCTLVGFSGHIGEAAVEHLKNCREVSATVNSIRAYRALAKDAAKFNMLEKLTVAVDFPKDEVRRERCCHELVRHSKVKVNLHFLNLINDDVTETINFIRCACPRGKTLSCVTFNGDVSFEDGLKIIKELQGVVNDVVRICSKRSLTEDQKGNLFSEALADHAGSAFRCNWNGVNIYS